MPSRRTDKRRRGKQLRVDIDHEDDLLIQRWANACGQLNDCEKCHDRKYCQELADRIADKLSAHGMCGIRGVDYTGAFADPPNSTTHKPGGG